MFRLLAFLLFLIAGLMVSEIPAYAAEYQITNDGLPKAYLSISGPRIVWMQEDSGVSKDVYMYDFATDVKTKISTAGFADMSNTFDKNLDIFGDLIVWRDQRIDADGDIYLVDLSKEPLTENRISGVNADSPRFPAVDGNRVAWSEDGAYGFPDGLIYQYLYNPATGGGMLSLFSPSDDPCHTVSLSPAISGNIVVWQDNEDNTADYEIYRYDISTGNPDSRRNERIF